MQNGSDPGPSISFGVAGWSYPDWNGYVYPSGEKNKLRFLARYVDMVEINSTFYRPPESRLSARWLEETASQPGFFFSAKLHQQITHQAVLEPGLVQAFHEGLAPLAEAGKLRCLLAQFRYDFRDTPDARDHLSALGGCFADIAPLVVEVRHNSWQAPGAQAFLKDRGFSVAHLDYPMAPDSFNMPLCEIGAHGYFRLHGRNRAAWFDKQAGRDETYNYYYSKAELEEIKARLLKIAKARKSMTLVANNHYHGKEVANALQLKAMATGQKTPVPRCLLDHYPELKEIACPEPSGDLFLNL